VFRYSIDGEERGLAAMRPIVGQPSNQPQATPVVARCTVICPVCGGELTELRQEQRCRRCAFTICEGCESSVPADQEGQ